MTKPIIMIAADTIHISAQRAEPFLAGEAFEARTEADAKHFEGLGHKRAKASKPLRNKMESQVANKSGVKSSV